MKERIKNQKNIFDTWDLIEEVLGEIDIEKKHQIMKILNQATKNAIKQERGRIVKKIEKVKEAIRKQTGSFKWDDCYNDCIKITRQNKV